MPEITESELKRQIEKADFAKMYFLYGEEKYLVRYYAGRLAAKAGAEGPKDFNMQRFDGAQTGVDQIADAVEALPVMAGKKCVEVADFDAAAMKAGDAEKLWELLGDLPDTCVLVMDLLSFNADVKKNKAWKKFLTQAGKAGVTVSLERRTQPQLGKLMCAGAARRGCSLTRDTAARIVGYCGNDMNTVLGELEKLCAYAGTGEITAEMTDMLTTRNLEARVFDLSKAILAGSSDRAFTILDLLFDQNEEPVSVLAVLSGAYLDLYRVKASIQSGYSAAEPAKYFDYAHKEFRLTNAERSVKRFSTVALRRSLDALLEADTALKTSRGDRRTVMDKLIASLLWISEKEN